MKKITVLLLSVLLLLAGCSTTTKPQEESQSENGDSSTTINVYTRDASSGTREAFEGAIDLEDLLTANAIEVSGNGDMATKVGADVNSIGYVSLTTDFAANNITPLQFNGVDASLETVLDGSYEMQRPFSYTTRAAGDFETEEKEQIVAAFIAFLTESTEGMQVVSDAGGIVDVTSGKPWAEVSLEHPIVTQDNSALTINTSGSTSVEKAITAALEYFQPMAGNVQFVINQTGSSDGHKRVLGSEKDGANAADIGFASRPFKDEEDNSAAIASGAFCQDAVVMVVNSSNTAVTNLTKDQANKVFSGSVSTWEEATK